MSHIHAEKSVMGMTNRSHKYIRPDDMIDQSGLLTLLKGNFPDVLKVCDQKGKDYLPSIFEGKDKKEDEKIQFSEFRSSVGGIAKDHNQSHGEMPRLGKVGDPAQPEASRDPNKMSPPPKKRQTRNAQRGK